MSTKYTKPNGQSVNVVVIDEVNKMICVDNGDGTNSWYHEHEFADWVKEGADDVAPNDGADGVNYEVDQQEEHDQPQPEEPQKKKRAYKKKEK